jgi:hypothetical protein
MWSPATIGIAKAMWGAWRTPASRGDATGLADLADCATESIGRNLREWAKLLDRQKSAVGLPDAAAFAAAHGLESFGRYLERRGFRGAASDVGDQVKKRPLPFVAAGLGAGFVLGRLVMSAPQSQQPKHDSR